MKSSSAFRSEHSFHHHSRSSSPARPMELFGSFVRPRGEPLGFPGKWRGWSGGLGWGIKAGAVGNVSELSGGAGGLWGAKPAPEGGERTLGTVFGEGDREALTPCSPPARPGSSGNIKTLGNTYQFTVDVSDFAPEDIIVTTSNNQIEVHAEKVSAPPPPPHPPTDPKSRPQRWPGDIGTPSPNLPLVLAVI